MVSEETKGQVGGLKARYSGKRISCFIYQSTACKITDKEVENYIYEKNIGN